MRTYPSIVLANSSDLATNLIALELDYLGYHGESMSLPERRYYQQRMQLSTSQNMAYQMKESFIYICYEPDNIRVIAVGFNDTAINDAYFIATILLKHKPWSYMPQGRNIKHMLPFINRVSHKKWFYHKTKDIKLLAYDQLTDLLEYLDV